MQKWGSVHPRFAILYIYYSRKCGVDPASVKRGKSISRVINDNNCQSGMPQSEEEYNFPNAEKWTIPQIREIIDYLNRKESLYHPETVRLLHQDLTKKEQLQQVSQCSLQSMREMLAKIRISTRCPHFKTPTG